MIITIVIIVLVLTSPSPGIACNPSTADVTDIGGVIMPSASSVAPPTIAGNTVHLPCLRTCAKSAKVPPSPLLSAFSVRKTYLTVVCKVSVQITQDNPPSINASLITFPLQIAFKTYSGEVPISP